MNTTRSTGARRPLLCGALYAGVALAAAGLSGGCGGGEDGPREISLTRTRSMVRERVLPGATSEQRFGSFRQDSGAASAGGGEPQLPFLWEVPEGWESLQPTEYRLIHFAPGGHPQTACYLSVFPEDGGGVRANVDMWRTSMGLEPLTDGEFEAMPSRPLLGGSASYVEIEGPFVDKNNARIESAKLVGMIRLMPAFAVFVKMTGPRDVVNAELDAFEAFCDSLEFNMNFGAPQSGAHGGDGHGGPDHGSAGGLGWHTPAGWREGPARQMRLVTYEIGQSGLTECYLSRAMGSTLDNVNRWRGQVGEASLDAAGLRALPTVSVLGRDAVLVEASGEYRGMGGESRPGTMILGLVVQMPGESLFVKMVGPQAEVLTAREDFLAFAQSLHADG